MKLTFCTCYDWIGTWPIWSYTKPNALMLPLVFNVNYFLVKLFSGVLRRRSQPAQGLSLGRGRGVVLHEEGRHGPQDPGGRKIQRPPNQGRRCKTIIFNLKLLLVSDQFLHVLSIKWVVWFRIVWYYPRRHNRTEIKIFVNLLIFLFTHDIWSN